MPSTTLVVAVATLLTYCGIGRDVIEFTVTADAPKQGLFLPGTHIPVRAPADLVDARPDLVLILPWNLADEITASLAAVREWGGRLLLRRPALTVAS